MRRGVWRGIGADLEGCDRHLRQLAATRDPSSLSLSGGIKGLLAAVSRAMKICGVEEAEMNEASIVCAAYAYLSYVETRLCDHEQLLADSPPPPSFPASLSRPLSSPASSTARRARSRRPREDPSSPGRGRRIDFLSRLPPEIAVHILRFLHPRHLCRVVQVCRRWCWLGQCGCLRIARLRYVQRKREKFRQCKENVLPGQRHANQTPQTLTRNSLAEIACSPLASIQSSRQRHARHALLNSPYGSTSRSGETPVQLPRYGRSLRRSGRHAQSPALQTPEGVSRHFHRPTDEDSGYTVRRCLFPHSPSLSQHKQLHHTTSTSPLDDRQTVVNTDLSITKSATKRRLKRL